jgi:hypothetical protein
MILVDSSVWIDSYRGVQDAATIALRREILRSNVLVGDLILLEVLQGFRVDREYQLARSAMLSFDFCELCGQQVALAAAANYRLLRSKGITVRKTIDMVIGSYCIMHGIELLHTDRDFDPLQQHLGLAVYKP